MRILITGGAGFIGSHVADAFLAAGHAVGVLDDLSSGSQANLDPRVRFWQADIRDPAVEGRRGTTPTSGMSSGQTCSPQSTRRRPVRS